MKMQLIIEVTDASDAAQLAAIISSVSDFMGKDKTTRKVSTSDGCDAEVLTFKKKLDEDKPEPKKRGPKPKLAAKPVLVDDDSDEEDTVDENEADVDEEPLPKKDSPKLKSSKAKKGPSLEEVQEKFREFVGEHGRAKAAKILGKFGCNSVVKLEEEYYDEILELLKAED